MANRVEEDIRSISGWMVRGTLNQFLIEAEAKLDGTEYTVEMEGDTLHFYETHQEGGFLGIGKKTVKEPVLEIVRKNGLAEIPSQPRDAGFVELLAKKLEER